MNQQVLAQKKETVAQINDVLKKSHSAIVVSYSGLSAAEINGLRNDLKKAGARLKVQKNALLKKAIDEDGLSELDACLKGQSALVTSAEEGAGLQVLNDFQKSHSKAFTIKGGMIGGTYCNDAKLAELAPIGTKSNALASLLSTLQSPLIMLALTLKAVGEKAN